MQAVLGLVEDDRVAAAEHLVGDFLLGEAVLLEGILADVGFLVVEGGQAVEEDAVRVAGLADEVHGDAVGLSCLMRSSNLASSPMDTQTSV